MEQKTRKLAQSDLKQISESQLENWVYWLSCALNQADFKEIVYKSYLNKERIRILKELTRRDELIKNIK